MSRRWTPNMLSLLMTDDGWPGSVIGHRYHLTKNEFFIHPLSHFGYHFHFHYISLTLSLSLWLSLSLSLAPPPPPPTTPTPSPPHPTLLSLSRSLYISMHTLYDILIIKSAIWPLMSFFLNNYRSLWYDDGSDVGDTYNCVNIVMTSYLLYKCIT